MSQCSEIFIGEKQIILKMMPCWGVGVGYAVSWLNFTPYHVAIFKGSQLPLEFQHKSFFSLPYYHVGVSRLFHVPELYLNGAS